MSRCRRGSHQATGLDHDETIALCRAVPVRHCHQRRQRCRAATADADANATTSRPKHDAARHAAADTPRARPLDSWHRTAGIQRGAGTRRHPVCGQLGRCSSGSAQGADGHEGLPAVQVLPSPRCRLGHVLRPDGWRRTAFGLGERTCADAVAATHPDVARPGRAGVRAEAVIADGELTGHGAVHPSWKRHSHRGQ